MISSYRLVLSVMVVLVLHGRGVFVCSEDEFERGPPFDEEGEYFEECNDDSIICEVRIKDDFFHSICRFLFCVCRMRFPQVESNFSYKSTSAGGAFRAPVSSPCITASLS